MSKKYSIILVEDEKRFIDTIVKASENYEAFEIIATPNLVSTAYDLIKAKRPEIIITDVLLPDDSGLNLIRKVKNNTEFSDYKPYIVGITSYASQTTQQQLKDLSDIVILKNSFFRADRIFIELRFAIQSREFNEQPPSPSLDFKETKIEQAISEILNQFNVNPKLERHRKCIINMIILILQLDNLNDFNLKDLYNEIAPTVNVKNHSGVNSLITRYLSDILIKTDAGILKQIFQSCCDSKNPTAKEFFLIIAQETKQKLNS